jgi:hypothetical protein
MTPREMDPGGIDGDPTEERGPEHCEAEGEACELKPGEHEAPPEEAEVAFASELDEAYAPDVELLVPHAIDGLPYPERERDPLALAPSFTIDNVVCVEDDREYVELWRDEIVDALGPGVDCGVAAMLKLCARNRFDGRGFAQHRLPHGSEEVAQRWGVWTIAGAKDGEYVAVRPVRECCEHYRCQVMNNDDQQDPTQAGHKIIFRNCAARKSVGGALMSLRDQAVYSCDYRSPPDERSANDFHDRERVRLHGRAHEQLIPFLRLKEK